MCNEEYLLMLMKNTNDSKEISRAYASKPTNYGRQYAATQVIFSRPLGINYVSAGLSTPVSSYLSKARTYTTIAYQKYVKPMTKEIESRRDLLMKTISRERDSLYSGLQLRYT